MIIWSSSILLIKTRCRPGCLVLIEKMGSIALHLRIDTCFSFPYNNIRGPKLTAPCIYVLISPWRDWTQTIFQKQCMLNVEYHPLGRKLANWIRQGKRRSNSRNTIFLVSSSKIDSRVVLKRLVESKMNECLHLYVTLLWRYKYKNDASVYVDNIGCLHIYIFILGTS